MPNNDEHRLNERIRVPQVRLVGENLDELSALVGETIESTKIYSIDKAMEFALKAELDLVEIGPNSEPPVCRIVEYKKFLYERKKKEKEMKAKQVKSVLKEVRFGPHTDDHDFNFKVKHAQEFLGHGDKVKAYVQFRGRAIAFKQHGEDILRRFVDALSDVGVLDGEIKLEGRKMMLQLSPKKKKVAKESKDEAES